MVALYSPDGKCSNRLADVPIAVNSIALAYLGKQSIARNGNGNPKCWKYNIRYNERPQLTTTLAIRNNHQPALVYSEKLYYLNSNSNGCLKPTPGQTGQQLPFCPEIGAAWFSGEWRVEILHGIRVIHAEFSSAILPPILGTR